MTVSGDLYTREQNWTKRASIMSYWLNHPRLTIFICSDTFWPFRKQNNPLSKLIFSNTQSEKIWRGRISQVCPVPRPLVGFKQRTVGTALPCLVTPLSRFPALRDCRCRIKQPLKNHHLPVKRNHSTPQCLSIRWLRLSLRGCCQIKLALHKYCMSIVQCITQWQKFIQMNTEQPSGCQNLADQVYQVQPTQPPVFSLTQVIHDRYPWGPVYGFWCLYWDVRQIWINFRKPSWGGGEC